MIDINVIPEVKGCVSQKRGRLILSLWWYEKGERKTKWISTGLLEKGNKRKAENLLGKAIEEQTLELKEKTLKLCQSKATGNRVNSDSLFGDYLKYWLEIVKPDLQISTYNDYHKKIYNQIAPYFDKRKITLGSLSFFELQDFYAFKQKTITSETTKRYHANINKALKYAFRHGLIKENPASSFEFPKHKKSRVEYCKIHEIQQVLEITRGTNIEIPVIIACFYGLRRSEALALQWSAIDFNEKTITVKLKVSQIKGVNENKKSLLYFTKDLKTEASHRVLPLLPEVEQVLLNHREQIKENQTFYGNTYIKDYSDFVCVNEKGDLIKPDYVTRVFPQSIAPLKLGKHVTYHGLRHSCATMLLSLGYDIKLIQLWLGHGSYKTTADFYAHLDMKGKLVMGQSINSSLHVQ